MSTKNGVGVFVEQFLKRKYLEDEICTVSSSKKKLKQQLNTWKFQAKKLRKKIQNTWVYTPLSP